MIFLSVPLCTERVETTEISSGIDNYTSDLRPFLSSGQTFSRSGRQSLSQWAAFWVAFGVAQAGFGFALLCILCGARPGAICSNVVCHVCVHSASLLFCTLLFALVPFFRRCSDASAPLSTFSAFYTFIGFDVVAGKSSEPFGARRRQRQRQRHIKHKRAQPTLR